MHKISIVIPVYNVEEYLNECIDSILGQEFSDYEVILVNDGSTDNSGRICESYSTKYSCIKTIHKKNGGLSDARNKGVENASGEFILFIDSDDYIFKGALENIANTVFEAPEVDVVFFDAVKLFPGKRLIPLNDGYKKPEIFMKSQKDVLNHLSNLSKFPGSACTKLVRRQLIEEESLFFKKGLLSEDIDWTIRLLLSAQKYNYCQYNCYCYRQNRKGSITTTVNFNNLKDLFRIIKEWGRKPGENSRHYEYQVYINAFLAYEYMVAIFLFGYMDINNKKKIKQEIKSYSWLLRCSQIKKVVAVKNIYRIFGLEITSKLLNIYYAKLKR